VQMDKRGHQTIFISPVISELFDNMFSNPICSASQDISYIPGCYGLQGSLIKSTDIPMIHSYKNHD